MDDYPNSTRIPGPRLRTFPLAYLRSLRHPEWLPHGVQDIREILDGTITANLDGYENRTPIVLVHGTWMNSFNAFAMLGPFLARHRPVFTLDYGTDSGALVSHLRSVKGTADLGEAFDEVTELLNRFRTHLNLSRIDLIGHSQGGLHCRSYANATIDSLYDDALARGLSEEEAEQFAADNSPVRAVISLAGNHHGTSAWGARRVLRVAERLGLPIRILVDRLIGRAGLQQLLDSEYIATLNRTVRGVTRRGPHYLNIGTPFDTIVRPWTGAHLPERTGHRIINVNNASGGSDWSDHLALLYSPNTMAHIREFLDELDGAELKAELRRRVRVLPMYGALPRWRRR
ncbi:MAG: alpha/beta fold hydrolase [Corynebacterium sp.]|uniref:esterase/lipase family protein n=1 Tax=Corynebacterium sp. TaxID=1720 RepID=UPI0026DD6BAD|nr:alpha/beta fold hydrolase [Corynebacterium sp.]MDO5030095.1 alpha/beta fold hydrolase [Corynebacterium sp.]